MTSKDLFEIVGQTKPEHRQQAVEALFADELQKMEGSQNMNRKTVWSAGRIVLAAAVAALLLATAAFAADLFGVQALLTGDRMMGPTGETFDELTLSQPQAVPEGLDPDTARMIENQQAAAAEWQAYCDARPSLSAVLDEWVAEGPEGTEKTMTTKTADLRENSQVWSPVLEKYPTAFALTVYMDGNGGILGGRPITEEEWALHMEQIDASMSEENAKYANLYCGEYDIRSQEDAGKLEEIAAQYGLKLLESVQLDAAADTVEELTEEGVAELMTTVGCAGNIFRDLPTAIGRIVRYNEGSFYVDCAATLPSGQRATIQAYKTMYSTLGGVAGQYFIPDAEKLSEQSYTADDGTEITVLSDNERVFVYTFLEDAFFAVSASGTPEKDAPTAELTQEDINYIADFFNYSLIEG